MSRFFLAGLGLLVSVFLFTTLVNTPADARAGSGFSSGSRGSFTFSRPPSTSTAPKPAAPIERSYTQPTAPSYSPSYAPAGGFGGGLFSGFGGGLMGGLLGAGLFGMMFGNGFFGGMGGGMSFFGLLLQFGLIYFAVKFLFGLFARRVAPMGAGFGPIPQPSPNGFGGGSGFQSSAPSVRPVTIDQADYAAFEEKLHAVQDAYSREDIDALRNVATPEMVAYFAEDLARNAGQGLVNRVSDVRLLQGDLAEAWGEGATEYATVAMKFSLIDTMIDRSSGSIVSGGQPEQVTELWTFRHDGPGAWMLSAIQQTR
jgi:predicted lipid-binding transport protein (Tim44 family)